SLQTSISKDSQHVQIANTIGVEESFKEEECGTKTIYLGDGTNWLKGMFGMDFYINDRFVKNHGAELIVGWILSPIGLSIGFATEIIGLQPFHAYKDIRSCDTTNVITQNKEKTNLGNFTGSIKVENTKTNEIVDYPYTNSSLPIEISLQDENDMFSASKRTIESTDALLVFIDGKYYIDGKNYPVKESKEINK
ncbi:MAG: hypothetical protein U9P72_08125, partial [Campylobacterota bacterium]|nr:hypothetical protein [Campylobacterota bacterium]